MTFAVTVFRVASVRQHEHADGQNLSIVTLVNHPRHLVANKRDDGSFRYAPGDLLVLFPENAIIPDDLLKGWKVWTDKGGGKGKGPFGGNRGNRVTKRTFAEVESRGYMVAVTMTTPEGDDQPAEGTVTNGAGDVRTVHEGDDLTEFFGVTEYVKAA